jgi:hypothetical protein
MAESEPAGTASSPGRDRAAGGTSRTFDVDEDEDQLAAYNASLARINHEPASAAPCSAGPDETTSAG